MIYLLRRIIDNLDGRLFHPLRRLLTHINLFLFAGWTTSFLFVASPSKKGPLIMKVLLTFLISFVISCVPVLGQNILITGSVTDAETNDPLPFATVGINNSAFGTVSNGDGFFELSLPEKYQQSSLKCSYLGYKSTVVPPNKLGKSMTIRLERSTIELAGVIVRPLAPEDYIKRAVKKFPENYTTDPFSSTAYYREKFTENGNFLGMSEGYFKSYSPNYQDTVKNQYQLLLHRKVDDISEVAFLKNKRDKKERKEAKKANKTAEKGKDIEADTLKNDIDAGILTANFGGPEEVLNGDVVRNLDDFLDSAQFKKYSYQFEQDFDDDDKKIMVISFKSKGTYEHVKQKGIIYIDQRSEAIIAIDFTGEVIIPILVQPILFALGFSLNDMYITKKLRYQQIDKKWFPNTIQWDFTAELKKRYLFKSNETSVFAGEQIYNIDQIILAGPEEIPATKRFDGSKDIEEQVHQVTGLDWSDVNTLKIEDLKKQKTL
ncbi:MAG: hypothetical protein ACI9A7_000968 [Cyclobacteriaceae bacterium]